ncbi:CgeB family protein [Micromonospora sp. URMC 105]|uniref:CgeB family protein n=1 Tax=Micromonospora sp. URMC 105 TaxID=3423413 RepID=UPI003F1A6AD2
MTTKRHNVPELLARGVSNVEFVFSAYDPAWHHISYRRSPRKWSIGFVGNYRPDRVEIFRTLGSEFPDQCAIYGPYWRRQLPRGIPGVHLSGARYAEDFSTTVSEIVANLVLLNSDNRDTHTCRSFEVPAAGGLFVGEKTHEHEELLTDEKECFLFSSEQDLIEILHRIRRFPETAQQIAAAGHRRVTTSGHTYADRARQIMQRLDLE